MVNDIVVYGATGFVGRLVAGHLAGGGARVALAGRSKAKLERVRDELGVDWPLIVADTDDPASLAAMAQQARVVATTVGPYRRGGIGLVDACIAAGAHYCDLTGEILFAHESLTRHEAAESAGVKIVHSVGFDSIPSDLGTFLLHDAAGELGPTTLAVTALKGGFSGGTLASMKGQVDEATADKAVAQDRLRPVRARRRRPARARPAQGHAPQAAGLDRPVRDGDLQHADRPPQPLAAGLRPGASATARSRATATRRWRVGTTAGARRAGRRPRLPAHAQGARPACSRTRARARASTRARPATSR